MNFLQLAQQRYSCKAYDQQKKIPQQDLQQLLEILRLTPSSINIQPWKFLLAHSDDSKAKICQAMQTDHFHYNIPKILHASDVIVFTARTDIDTSHLTNIIASEDLAQRFKTEADKQKRADLTQHYVDLYRQQDFQQWIDQQLYIALGSLLMAAPSLNIDTTAIGGFDAAILDDVLQLPSQHLHSVVIVALGYRAEQDFNAHLGKGRLPLQEIIQEI